MIVCNFPIFCIVLSTPIVDFDIMVNSVEFDLKMTLAL